MQGARWAYGAHAGRVHSQGRPAASPAGFRPHHMACELGMPNLSSVLAFERPPRAEPPAAWAELLLPSYWLTVAAPSGRTAPDTPAPTRNGPLRHEHGSRTCPSARPRLRE
ncbi:hypothetical protein SAV31267_034720 [Streptomyces avermitilis]|uniref:Uncharacterized protein n=1 Tax=Streptomyces avermitilis TaxID=33903 RepID=A0A4D4MS81_STRAX|nr:hypothetical protein SAV31267_034720 [Streptomyces avermitilis]